MIQTFTPIIPTNLLGQVEDELLILAEKVCIKSATLQGGHTPETIESIKELLRKINSYYSNKIESQGTHPIDIDKAMRQEYSQDSKERNLQMLSLMHIKTQKYIEELFEKKSDSSAFCESFICDIHQFFYSDESMKPFLTIEYKNKNITMIPGHLRQKDVTVGHHIAPSFTMLKTLMHQFEDFYKPIKSTQAMKLIYALSSHHRLTWIHPFLDGNGRTARLALDGALYSIKLQGYGLWNISRGLSRQSDLYKKFLAQADMPRQGDYDGRGALSMKSLYSFVKFMLQTALDQIEFMQKNLNLSILSERLEKYVVFSQNNLLNIDPLPKHTLPLLKELLLQGEIKRGKVKNIIGSKDRTAIYLINELIQRDFIYSSSTKGALKLKINAHLGSYLFPELLPNKE